MPVQNRVVDIRRNVNPNSLFYCRTYDNPADIITRFETESLESLDDGLDHVFLRSNNDLNDQNVDNYGLNVDLFDEEVLRNEVLLAAIEENETFIDSVIDIERYSDFFKLLRVTALVYRFTVNFRKKVTKKSLTLCKYVTTKEMRIAKLLWLKCN